MKLHADTQTLAALALGRSLSILLVFANTILLGRLLGPQGFGEWSLMLGAATLAHAVLISWTHASTIRFGAEEWTRHRTLRKTLGARVPLVLAGGAVISLIFLLDPGRLLSRLFGLTPGGAASAWLYCLSLWLAAEVQSTMQVSGAMARHALLVPAATFLLNVAVGILWLLRIASADQAMRVLAATSLAFWAFVWLKNARRALPDGFAIEREEVVRQVRYGWPLLPAFAVGYISAWAGYLIVQAWRPAPELGVFGLAHQTMLTLTTASGILTTLLGPRLIERQVTVHTAARDYVSSVIPTALTMWLLLAIWLVAALPIALVLAAGEDYRASADLVIVLAAGLPGIGVTALYSVLFSLQQRLTATLLYNAAVMTTSVGLSLLLVPRWGALGACTAAAASYGVGQALYLADQHRTLSLPSSKSWLLLGVAAGIGMSQLAVGSALLPRLVWAGLATAGVVAASRLGGFVNADLVRRVTVGSLQPLGVILNRVLTPAGSSR